MQIVALSRQQCHKNFGLGRVKLRYRRLCGHHAKTLQPHLIAKAITIYDPERYMEKREPLG
jgi:hypothetical protein